MDIVTRTEILLGRLNRISSDQTLGYILESKDSSPNDADEAFEFVKEAPEVMRELLSEVKNLREERRMSYVLPKWPVEEGQDVTVANIVRRKLNDINRRFEVTDE